MKTELRKTILIEKSCWKADKSKTTIEIMTKWLETTVHQVSNFHHFWLHWSFTENRNKVIIRRKKKNETLNPSFQFSLKHRLNEISRWHTFTAQCVDFINSCWKKNQFAWTQTVSCKWILHICGVRVHEATIESQKQNNNNNKRASKCEIIYGRYVFMKHLLRSI